VRIQSTDSVLVALALVTHLVSTARGKRSDSHLIPHPTHHRRKFLWR